MQHRKFIVGFTLIEIAIVMIVIGLVIGGVLVGRDLITSAEIRRLIKQPEQFDTAIMAFRLKYNCLPGDCKNAGRLGFTTTVSPYPLVVAGSIEDGNGDGFIRNTVVFDDISSTSPTGNFEIEQAWWWLQQAGMVGDVKLGTVTWTRGFINATIPAAITGGGQYGGRPVWSVLYFNAQDVLLTNGYFTNTGHYFWLTGDPFETGAGSYAVLLPIKA